MSWEIVTGSFRTEKFFFLQSEKVTFTFSFFQKVLFFLFRTEMKKWLSLFTSYVLFRTECVCSSPTISKMQKCRVIKMMQGEIGARLSSDPAVINERRWTSSSIGRGRDRPLLRPWGSCTSWWRWRRWSGFQRRLIVLRSLQKDENLIGKDLTSS